MISLPFLNEKHNENTFLILCSAIHILYYLDECSLGFTFISMFPCIKTAIVFLIHFICSINGKDLILACSMHNNVSQSVSPPLQSRLEYIYNCRIVSKFYRDSYGPKKINPGNSDLSSKINHLISIKIDFTFTKYLRNQWHSHQCKLCFAN